MGFADDHLIPLVDEGLGNSAYLVDLGDGRALAVDASRDLRSLHAAASRRGLKKTACSICNSIDVDGRPHGRHRASAPRAAGMAISPPAACHFVTPR